MELLILRHGEKHTGVGVAHNPDGALTDLGMRQACTTAAWLNYEFNLKGYRGFVSPYLRTLQTASVLSEVCDVEFGVNTDIREWKPSIEPIHIPNRSLTFQNFQWPAKEWSGKSLFYPTESPEDFVDRCGRFLYRVKEAGYDKVVVVTHGSGVVVLAELAMGKEPEVVRHRVENAAIAKAEGGERANYLTAAKVCSLTLVKDGKPLWFNKIVYEF